MIESEEYLYNLRMEDKYTRQPSMWEIAGAFPECRLIVKEIRDRLIDELDVYKPWIEREIFNINFLKIDPRLKIVNDLQKYLDYTKPSKDNKINKDKAKAVPIQDLYDFQKVFKTSTRIKALCPFHHEKTSSFLIYLKSNTFHCFGCHQSGDSIDFIMKLKGIGFIQAVKELSN